jgi:hypothetical protein
MQQDCAFRRSFRFALAGTLLLATAAPALAGPYAAAVMADSPYAYWRFNETSGTVAADSSGNGIGGTYVNTPTLGQAGPLAEPGNTAVRFTRSSSEYMNVAATFGGAGWNQVTVEAWVNLASSSSDFQAIVSSLGLNFVHLQVFGVGGNVVFGTGGDAILPILTPAQTTGWHHVALTAKAGEQRLYLDGNLIGSAASPLGDVIAATPIRVGAGYSGGRFFDGWIDEVAIYRSALSEAQIDAHIAAAIQVATLEPASMALVGAGLLGLAGLRRRAACLPSA